MLKSPDNDHDIKLIDFGLSTSYLEQVKEADGRSKKVLTRLKTCAGTSLYMAPEVIKKQYSHSCDIWSAGVILYIMLSGYPPFYGENDMEVFEKILRYEYDFEDQVWQGISNDAKELICKMLSPVQMRIPVKDALKNPWVERHTRMSREYELTGEIMNRITSFS